MTVFKFRAESSARKANCICRATIRESQRNTS